MVQMASASVSPSSHFCKMSRNSMPFHPAPTIAHIPLPKTKLLRPMHFHNCRRRRTTHMVSACGADDSHRARETVLKLFEAIKDKNVHQISDIIAEECSCVSNFVSAFQPFLGKKQVLDFFSSLMKFLGNNIEFVVQQTSDDGMVVSVSWKLEWRKVPLRLGKGFSLYTCHVYKGRVMIRNVEMFLEPLFHMEPLRLKLMALVMDKLHPQILLKNRATKTITIFFLLFIAALACLFRFRAIP